LHLRIHQNALLEDQKIKNVLGRGHSPPPQTPPPLGRGTPQTPPPSAPSALRFSRLRRSCKFGPPQLSKPSYAPATRQITTKPFSGYYVGFRVFEEGKKIVFNMM